MVQSNNSLEALEHNITATSSLEDLCQVALVENPSLSPHKNPSPYAIRSGFLFCLFEDQHRWRKTATGEVYFFKNDGNFRTTKGTDVFKDVESKLSHWYKRPSRQTVQKNQKLHTSHQDTYIHGTKEALSFLLDGFKTYANSTDIDKERTPNLATFNIDQIPYARDEEEASFLAPVPSRKTYAKKRPTSSDTTVHKKSRTETNTVPTTLTALGDLLGQFARPDTSNIDNIPKAIREEESLLAPVPLRKTYAPKRPTFSETIAHKKSRTETNTVPTTLTALDDLLGQFNRLSSRDRASFMKQIEELSSQPSKYHTKKISNNNNLEQSQQPF